MFWASWGSGNRVPGTSSGNRIRVSMGSEGCVKEVSEVSVFDGFRGARGFDGTVSGNRVPGRFTSNLKKKPLEKETDLPNHHFQVQC